MRRVALSAPRVTETAPREFPALSSSPPSFKANLKWYDYCYDEWLGGVSRINLCSPGRVALSVRHSEQVSPHPAPPTTLIISLNPRTVN